MVDIKTIWATQQKDGSTNISRTRLEGIQYPACFAGTNLITDQLLFIMEISATTDIPDMKQFRFKGVEMFTLDMEEPETRELYIYLLDIELKDIYTLFIQNILDEITICFSEEEALRNTFNTIAKWKKLFDKIMFEGLSAEQQKGLIGELLFIDYLLDNGLPAPRILNSWTGIDFTEQDFRFGKTGIEIKFTSSKHPCIKITNENQLDIQDMEHLFLVLYSASEVKDGGITLPGLVEQIRMKLENQAKAEELNHFNGMLLLLGYSESDASHYKKRYSIKQVYAFKITEEFPRITRNNLPTGIYNVSYHIELSSVENYKIDLNFIPEHL